jgi:hypothetical protein
VIADTTVARETVSTAAFSISVWILNFIEKWVNIYTIYYASIY